jgi:hypothetical protein
VIDPGRFTYEPESPWRQWFKGTAAHNTVCVDGLDQTPFRPGKPRARSTAVLLGRFATPGLDVLRGEVRSPAYDAIHVRTVAFVDDDYWIVHDRLRAATAHRYESRWHLAPQADGAIVDGGPDVQRTVRLPGGQLIVPPGSTVLLEDGWFSPAYGIRVPAPVVVLRANGAYADLLTVLLPGNAGADVSWTCAGDRVDVAIARPGRPEDVVSWSTAEVVASLERRSC